MSNEKITTIVINNEQYKEIIKIKKGDKSIIVYSYNESSGVIMYEQNKEPIILATTSRDMMASIIKSEQKQENLFNLCDGTTGNVLGCNTDLYHISKVVLETISLKEKACKYKAKSFEYNKNTDSYDFKCIYVKSPISVPSFAIHSLIKYEDSKAFEAHIGFVDYELDKQVDKKFINIKDLGNNCINIIDVTTVYEDLRFIAKLNHFISDMKNKELFAFKTEIDCNGNFKITVNDPRKINKDIVFYITMDITKALNLFTGKVPLTDAILYSHRIGDNKCIIEHDEYTTNNIFIKFINDETLDCDINAECDFYNLLLEALQSALKGDKN